MIVNIIVSLMAIIVNWWLMVIFVTVLASFLGMPVAFGYQVQPWGAATIIIVTLLALSLTPVADMFFRVITGMRHPIREEAAKINVLFEKVCDSAGLSFSAFRLFVSDDKFPNAFALGRGNIAVSRGLLKHASDAEIMAVMAHEVGHHKNGDTIATRIFWTVSVLGQVVLIAYRFVATFLVGFSRIRLPFVGVAALLVGVFLKLQVWLIEIFVMLPLTFGILFGSRCQEYAADRFAVEIGHGSGLLLFLHQILDEEGQPSGFFGVIWRTHPRTGERIRRLEDMGVA